jgi:hypothetical protein
VGFHPSKLRITSTGPVDPRQGPWRGLNVATSPTFEAASRAVANRLPSGQPGSAPRRFAGQNSRWGSVPCRSISERTTLHDTKLHRTLRARSAIVVGFSTNCWNEPMGLLGARVADAEAHSETKSADVQFVSVRQDCDMRPASRRSILFALSRWPMGA